MCVCRSEVKTPFCGRPGCQWPTPSPATEQMELHDMIVKLRQDRGAHLMDENEYTAAILALIATRERQARIELLEPWANVSDSIEDSPVRIDLKALRDRLATLNTPEA